MFILKYSEVGHIQKKKETIDHTSVRGKYWYLGENYVFTVNKNVGRTKKTNVYMNALLLVHK